MSTLLQKHVSSTGETNYSVIAAAKSLQSCPTLCDPIDGSPPGSPIPGILHARILEWVAISFSSAWKWKVKVKLLSHVWLLATPWTAGYQAPPSVGFFQARVLKWGAIAFSNSVINPPKCILWVLLQTILNSMMNTIFNAFLNLLDHRLIKKNITQEQLGGRDA